MKLIFDSQRDSGIFAAVLRLALDAGVAVVEPAEPDPRAAGFGSDPFTRAPGVAVVGQLPIAPGANTSTTAPGGLALVPPPGSAAGAPSEPAAPSNPAGGAVAIDVHGLPWDSRIHAGTQGKNQDGSWKRKKGIGDVFYNDVAAELRRVMAIPAPAPVVAPPPPVDAPPLAPTAPVAPPAPPSMPPAPPAPLVAPVAPPPGPVPVTGIAPAAAPSLPPAPPVAPVAALPTPPVSSPALPPTAPTPADNIPAAGPVLNTEPKTFPELMSLATGLLQAGRIQQPELIAACQASGVPNLPSLAPRPDLIPSVAVTIMAMAKPAA